MCEHTYKCTEIKFLLFLDGKQRVERFKKKFKRREL